MSGHTWWRFLDVIRAHQRDDALQPGDLGGASVTVGNVGSRLCLLSRGQAAFDKINQLLERDVARSGTHGLAPEG